MLRSEGLIPPTFCWSDIGYAMSLSIQGPLVLLEQQVPVLQWGNLNWAQWEAIEVAT